MPASSTRQLFLISFVALYLEILLIRWLAANVRLLAYFTNLTLIAAFFGLSLGCLLTPRRRAVLRAWPAAWALLVLATWAFGLSEIVPDLKGQVLFHTIGGDEGWPISAVITLFYVLVVATFVPLGERLGEELEGLHPVRAYSVNIAGSIAGVVTFALFSFTRVPAIAWFAVLFAALLALRPPARWFRPALLLGGALAAFVVLRLDADGVRWSPYHRILITPVTASAPGSPPVTVGHQLFVNRDIYQFMLDLSPDSQLPVDPNTVMWRAIYELPYRIGAPRSVLVVGAGSGNDVAAALRAGVERVDAVEIDPLILEAGRSLHPERPYQDPRVHAHCQDARRFLQDDARSYDLVVMGYLDSQVLLSRMGNVRLDSFIYTRESFESVRERLTPDGYVVLYFAAVEKWMESRLRGLAESAFGPNIAVYKGWRDNLYVIAARRDGRPIPEVRARFVERVTEGSSPVELTTDDWPFLYLKERGIPRDYLWVLGLLLLLSCLALLLVTRGRVGGAPSMFFLGLAFLLLETLSITNLSLLYGATWIVSSIVICGFLVAILLANLLVLRRPPSSLALPYALLFLSVAANGLVPVSAFLALPDSARLVASTIFFTLPVLCAGVIFASRFSTSRDVTMDFGLNTMGAMLGGIVEYLTMALGFRALYGVVLLAYALSLIPPRRRAGG